MYDECQIDGEEPKMKTLSILLASTIIMIGLSACEKYPHLKQTPKEMSEALKRCDKDCRMQAIADCLSDGYVYGTDAFSHCLRRKY